ncbi:lipid kinase YegS [Halomonas sp. LR5S13]|uniref:lipid kinase YegS n=1 Tax=Halomonas rhizosphaerae TaxID=3043296 RepID=UPI0024A886AA|nr:lipid kinase YegS [Halomonas rhizosphaerae]MDI5921646.1 lipid kinase YegS [Halomonas rhizosphaerae]
MARLILNGKSAQLPAVREAVFARREAGDDIEVRVTWEQGDAARLAEQAGRDGVGRVIAGGGDGTVNEVVNGLMGLSPEQRPGLGILPLGSANDLATSLGLPLDGESALASALHLPLRRIDVPRLDDWHFLNMATCGFGADITSSTPKTLKRLLGGGAYSLIGAFKAWDYRLYPGVLRWEGGERRAEVFMLAIGNGRQSGGGQALTPDAALDDGQLDVLLLHDVASLARLFAMRRELASRPARGNYVDAFRTDWLTFEAEETLPVTLDGESWHRRGFEVAISPGALMLAAPPACPLFSRPP